MKSYFALGLIFVGVNTVNAATSGDKFLSYQENYPKSQHWYELETNSYCKENKDPISIQEFTSEKKYGGKSVRIVHVYAEAFNINCKDRVNEKSVRKIVIPVDNNRMTHVYVTYESQLTLKSGH